MDLQARKHTSSGSVGLGFALPLIAVVAASLGAIVYAYINVYSPIAGITTLICVAGLAAVVAVPVAIGAKVLKCRSTAWIAATGAFGGFAALFFAWAFFAAVLLRNQGLEMPLTHFVTNPGALWPFLGLLSETGWFEIKGVAPKGGFLWVLWILEAAIVVGAPTLIALGVDGETAFCESCNEWCDDEESIDLRLPGDDQVNALCEAGLMGLTSVAFPKSEDEPVLRVSLQRCPSCDFAVYTVGEVTRHYDERGELVESATELVGSTVANPKELRRFEKLSEHAAERFRKLLESIAAA